MYEKLSKLVGIDLVGNPDLINDPRTNILCSVIEFCQPATLAAADNDNVDRVSRLINGGDNELAERRIWTARWGKVPTA
jgi:putative chitinase